MGAILNIEHLDPPRICPNCGGEVVLVTGVGTWWYEMDVMIDVNDVDDIDTAGMNEEELEEIASAYYFCSYGCGYIKNASQDLIANWIRQQWPEVNTAPTYPSKPQKVMRYRVRRIDVHPFPRRYTCFYTHIFLEELLAGRRKP